LIQRKTAARRTRDKPADIGNPSPKESVMPAPARPSKPLDARPFDASPFPDFPDVMSNWMTAAASNAQAIQTEWASFVARRLEHDRTTMQRFASCRDFMEAAKVQQDWFAEAMGSYLEESRRFAAIAMEPTKNAAAQASRFSEAAQ
jgi:hypothetical protein